MCRLPKSFANAAGDTNIRYRNQTKLRLFGKVCRMQNNAPSTADYPFTTSYVARTLGVSEGYIRQLAQTGRLPSVRLANGMRTFSPSDVAKLQRERADR